MVCFPRKASATDQMLTNAQSKQYLTVHTVDNGMMSSSTPPFPAPA